MALVNEGFLHYSTNSIAYNIHNNRVSLKREDVANLLGFEHQLTISRLLEPEDVYESQNTIFIYESGLYTLIAQSRNRENSRSFKKWVIREIEKMKNELFEETRRCSLRLKRKEIEKKKIKKDQIVYIASTAVYAKQNIFKVGGVGRQDLLAARFANYNSRSAAGDEFGCVLTINVPNFRQFESRFWDLLSEFKDKRRKEMIKMPYEYLKELFTLLANNYNKEADFINNNLPKYLEDVNNNRKEPMPVPIERVVAEKKRIKKSYVTLPDEKELKKEIEKYMMNKKSSSNTPSVAFLRSEINDHCTKVFKKFSKREAWKMMKNIQGEHKEFRLIY